MPYFVVDPVGKPRMTQRDVWAKRPAVLRYRDFCDRLRAEAARQHYRPSMDGDRVVFWIEMPRSWSKKKRAQMYGEPHQQKPDLDNLLKAFLDALMGEDCTVWKITVEKRWGTYGRIEVDEAFQ